MVGASGTYSVQGTDLTLQPTQGRWIERDILGTDGGAHPIYPTPREFELSWQLISPEDFFQLSTFYNTVSNTGSVAVDLPQFGANGYIFNRYSGCILQEPTFDNYFNGFLEGARMLVINVV